MEDMRWAGTHDGGRLQRDAGQFRYNDTIGRHSISTKTVPVVGINFERSALCTHVGMCRGGRDSGF